jgi:D-serine deaminase-like pyridoxal phosphate-dependent protein
MEKTFSTSLIPRKGSIVDELDLDTPALYVDLDALERNIHDAV